MGAATAIPLAIYVNASGYIYILRENDERITIAQGSLSTGNLYFRVTLNFDGIFPLYFYPKTFTGNEAGTLFGLYLIIFARKILESQ